MPQVLSATCPLLVRTGTSSPVPDKPIAVVVFFLGAMAMKNCLANYQTRFSQLCPLPGAPKMSVGNDTYGITRIPTTVAGA